MKNITFLLAGVALMSVSCQSPQTVVTESLGDAVIAAAKEAERAGASKLTYQASVTTTKEGSASVVVPAGPVAPTFGFKKVQAISSTATIEVPISEAAKKAPSGEKFNLNLRTLEASPVRPPM